MAVTKALLTKLIVGQIEYLLSTQNLYVDEFLRRHMNEENFVEIRTLASFGRLRNMTNDLEFIAESLRTSLQLEVSEDGLRVRALHLAYYSIVFYEILNNPTVDEILAVLGHESCPDIVHYKVLAAGDIRVYFRTSEDMFRGQKFFEQVFEEEQGREIDMRLKHRTRLPPIELIGRPIRYRDDEVAVALPEVPTRTGHPLENSQRHNWHNNFYYLICLPPAPIITIPQNN